MTLTDPKLILEFLENDLAPGHSTTQTLGDTELVRRSFTFKKQRFNGLKSSSDTVSLQLVRKCNATEDIIATEGDIKAVLKDGDETLFTGFVSTSFSWSVTDHGEQVLNITLESVGTRLFNKAFIETGKYFFDCPASTAVYNIIHPLGITLHSGDERKLLQTVKKNVEAGTTCRDLMDQLVYECNAVYWFNNLGELCIQEITADTTGAQTYDSSNLRMKDRKVVSLSKKLRTYKGARVAYDEVSSASDHLVYRNTTNASATRVCNLELGGGEYFDGAEIYTAAEWAAATADTFREPTLIGAVNAASESNIVGSNEIMNISNLRPDVLKDSEITFTAEAVGGPYIKLLAHNTAGSKKTITRMDLYADIVYVKSHGVIRTQIDGPSNGKSMLEEDLEWIHDKDNASRHANLLAQYHKSAGASYTFYSNDEIPLGSVIKLNDDVYSGLEVYVLVTASQYSDKDDCYTYSSVGITTFDLTESAYHGTTEEAKQSGAQGPAGEPGAAAEVQYALGDSLVYPPGDTMQWSSADMLWGGDEMFWNSGTWEDDVPEAVRGQYIWMRMRVGDAPWQYTRLTGSTAWDPENLGVRTTSTPTQSSSGLGLIPGDYFVAGAQFIEGSKTYYAGYAYYYDGTGWADMDLSNGVNARKALDLLSALSSGSYQIPPSTEVASVWLWTKNFVAQNAVIQNLFAEQITILENGCIHSEYYNDDGTPKVDASLDQTGSSFSASFWNKALFLSSCSNEVGSYAWEMDDEGYWSPINGNPLGPKTSNAMQDYGIAVSGTPAKYNTITATIEIDTDAEGGFWLGANGIFKCHDGYFQGMFDCDVIKTEPSTTTSTSYTASDTTKTQAYNLGNALITGGLAIGKKYPASIQGSRAPVSYIEISPSPSLSSGIYQGQIHFYDSTYNPVNLASYMTISRRRDDTGTTVTETDCSMIGAEYVDKGTYLRYWNYYYATSAFTLLIYSGGNRLTLDIPSGPSGLTKGQLYQEGGIVKIVTT